MGEEGQRLLYMNKQIDTNHVIVQIVSTESSLVTSSTLSNSPNHPAALGALPSTPIYLSPAAYPHRSRSDYAWHYIYQALEAILMQKGGPVFVRTRVKMDIRL